LDAGLALRLGFSFASFEPTWPRLAFGVPMQTVLTRRLLLRFEPGLEWGLAHTDVNGAAFFVPLRLQIVAHQRLSLYAQSGLLATWSDVNRRYVIPAGIGLQLALLKWLDVGLELTVVAKAGSEMPEAARRIFYDSAATITPAIYDRSLLANLRLHGGAGKIYRAISEVFADEDDEVTYHEPPPPRPLRRAPPPRPVCAPVEY
jgi:hypothetical protein